jgi:hypothetical protein
LGSNFFNIAKNEEAIDFLKEGIEELPDNLAEEQIYRTLMTIIF